VAATFRLSAVLALFALASCASATYLKTEEAKSIDVTATYTLFLYGQRYSNDVENLAVLDKEGDAYTFAIYAPGYDYRVERQVPGKDALADAERFIRAGYAARSVRPSEILDASGHLLGYELRPLYSPADYGYPDILDVSYLVEDGKVTVRIGLKQEIQRISDDEQPFIFRGVMSPH